MLSSSHTLLRPFFLRCPSCHSHTPTCMSCARARALFCCCLACPRAWSVAFGFVSASLRSPVGQFHRRKNKPTSRTGDVLIDMTAAVSMATFARLARSREFFRSTRPETKMTKQEVKRGDVSRAAGCLYFYPRPLSLDVVLRTLF